MIIRMPQIIAKLQQTAVKFIQFQLQIVTLSALRISQQGGGDIDTYLYLINLINSINLANEPIRTSFNKQTKNVSLSYFITIVDRECLFLTCIGYPITFISSL